MKETQKIVGLDESEEGAVVQALNELRNKEIADNKSGVFLGELILKVVRAPEKKVRVRDEAR
jgi:hypothetical protein